MNNLDLTNEEINNIILQKEYWEREREAFPKLVFKFRSLSSATDVVRAIDIVHNSRLYLPCAEELNDPFEGSNVDCLSDSKNNKLKETKKTYKILSLSKNCYSAPLWAFYTDDCSGICIGFYTNHSLCNVEKVDYVQKIDKKQWLCFDDVSTAVTEEYKYKHLDWSFEDEYRITKETDDVYLNLNNVDFACIVFGEKIVKEVKDTLQEEAKAKNIPTLDLVSDYNRSRYYLVPENDKGKRIYDLDSLYGFLMGINTRLDTSSGNCSGM